MFALPIPTEAKLVSLSKMPRQTLLPQIEIRSIVSNRNIHAFLEEDSESIIVVVETGYSAQLRHLDKLGEDITLRHIGADSQKADLMTRPPDRCKLDAVREMVGLTRVV